MGTLDRHGTGERMHIHWVFIMRHLLTHIYFNLHGGELALSSFCRSGSEALGRVRPLPEVMQLVSGAEFEPRSVETSEHCLLQGSTDVKRKQATPLLTCTLVHDVKPSRHSDKHSMLPFSSGWVGAFPSFHCPACPKGVTFFLYVSIFLLWHELTRAGSFLTFFRSLVPGT